MRSVLILVTCFILLALCGSILAPYDLTAINIPKRLQPPGENGCLAQMLRAGYFSRLLYGARWSLGLAFFVSFIGLIIGTIIGLVAALGGKIVDWLVMRTTDSFWPFPELVAAIVIAGLMVSTELDLRTDDYRLDALCPRARGIGLSLKTRDFGIQARLAGLSPLHTGIICRRFSSLTVVWTGMFARAILGISTLGFLGFGVQPPARMGHDVLDARIHMRSTLYK